MEIFKSNRSFSKFYPTLPETFFILNMSKLEFLNNQNGKFQVK